MLSNAYFIAKFRFDTAENEPAKKLQNFAKKLLIVPIFPTQVAEAQGRQEYQGVLENLERVLGHQRQLFGEKSEAVQDTAKRLWENYNYVATT